MSQVLTMWTKLSPLPLGQRLFSLAFARKAPYFATIRPRFTVLEPNRAELVIPKRRAVHNHIGTLHAIALCNGLEAAMGALAEATIPADRRWIPQGMEVSYTAKATSDVTCTAETDAEQWTGEDGDLPVRVRGVRDDGTVVIEGSSTSGSRARTSRPRAPEPSQAPAAPPATSSAAALPCASPSFFSVHTARRESE